IVTVLKSIGLFDSSGVPTADYAAVKDTMNGPVRLAALIRKTYDELYSTYDNAQSRTDEELNNFFRVHSKLGPKVVQYQLATFKVLCEFADFKSAATAGSKAGQPTALGMAQPQGFSGLHVTIELHLPESKDPNIYESIFQALARHLLKER
ncbi:DUF5343 domain-containing protein, partial [Candidatus Bathyarchaeota archaeon]|nr:DUF5343 domain-containing protein [Candidatus Bathyarchaeota archaeon]